MNKRKAAEDFYFMEKLSKNYKIFEIQSATVYPSNRGSWRVPFGTGQRVNRFLSGERDEYMLYSPSSFKILREWNQFYYNFEISETDEILTFAKRLNPGLHQFLIDQKFDMQWNRILENTKSPDQLSKQKKLWFDGFRTLKLIHFFKDTSFPNVNMIDALIDMFNLSNIPFKESVNSQKAPWKVDLEKYLQILRNAT
jgi:hypothetical protein